MHREGDFLINNRLTKELEFSSMRTEAAKLASAARWKRRDIVKGDK